MEATLSHLKRYFREAKIVLSDLWLQSCVEWIQSENPTGSLSQKDLQMKVYEQWLLLDLRDVQLAILPRAIADEVKKVLVGDYSLQLVQVVDISKPKYHQLQLIRNTTMTNDHSSASNKKEPPASRVLQLTLTDGVQEIIAMEYKPIAALNINMCPGAKIRLKGPLTVRRGRVMLEPSNVNVLGGEVEELLVSNAAENVLARALKLPENPKPRILSNTFEDADTQIFENSNWSTATAVSTQNAQSDKQPISTLSVGTAKKPLASRSETRSPDLFDDDFEFFNLDEIERVAQTKIHTVAELQSRGKLSGIFKIKAKFKSVVEKLSITDDGWSLKIAVEDDTGELILSVHDDVLTKLSGYSKASFFEEFRSENGIHRDGLKVLSRLRSLFIKLDCLMDVLYETEDTAPTIVKLYND